MHTCIPRSAFFSFSFLIFFFLVLIFSFGGKYKLNSLASELSTEHMWIYVCIIRLFICLSASVCMYV